MRIEKSLKKLGESLLKKVESISDAHKDDISSLQALPNNRFASASKKDKIKIWAKGKEGYEVQRKISVPNLDVKCLKRLNDNLLIASSADKKL